MSEKYLKMFEAFSSALAKKVPFKIKYKDSSLLMKILGFILFFNRRFMTKFVTTVGDTIYLPSKSYVANAENLGVVEVLAHEIRHIKDHNKVGKLKFFLTYMFPQALTPLALFLLFVNWWVALIAFVVLLLPWPAPGRKTLELNGYVMSLFFSDLIMQDNGKTSEERLIVLKKYSDTIDTHFTNLNYYLMWPFGVKEELYQAAEKIISGEIMKEDVIYSEVASAWNEAKSL